jgi:uncharacterized protein YigA (DUF484 family)
MDTLDRLSDRILVLRGVRVILDADLALLYGVQTRRLNEQVRRNLGRFPSEFLFRLTNHEPTSLMSQIATSKAGRGGTRKAPIVFTEHGAIMAAMVLNSPRAVEMSVFVVRAFVHLRKTAHGGRELDKRLDELENRVGTHDQAIREILAAIRQLTAPPETPRRKRIGFVQD